MSELHIRSRAPRRQSGFTLVELLIAVLIGLFLLGGLMTLVQDNRRTFASQNMLSQLQDSERLAMTMMTDVIQAGGYFPDPTTNTAITALPVAGTIAAGQPFYGTYNGAAPGDSITVRYATTTGDTIINCAGLTNTTGNIGPLMYTNTFSVLNGQLWCNLNGTAYPLVGTLTTSVSTLVPNAIIVNNLSILYGINSSGTGTNVDTYVNATGVTNWNNVISVKITLTFNNPLYVAGVAGAPQPQYITFQRIVSVMGQTGI
jgi:type IV pilus assembly protein PilW